MINKMELSSKAALLRKKFGEDESSPIDIFQVVQAIDKLTLVFYPLNNNISGICYKGKSSNVIIINSDMSLGRQRFSLAHELYHLYFDESGISSASLTTIGKGDENEKKAEAKHDLIIVQTGRGHADLSADYSSIPTEMKKVAEFFGKSTLSEVDENEFYKNLPKIRAFAGDRAVLRSIHFFDENKRVDNEIKALKNNDFDSFLKNITDSGNSSWKYLQNVYTNAAPNEQGITVALALSERFLKEKNVGATRVHGGGFAGVIMAMVPENYSDEYVSYMDKFLGKGSSYKMKIRPYGSICLDEMI